MSKGQSTAVEVKAAGALVLAGSFEEDAQAGFSNMNQDDYALPFLRLLTNTSPEVGEVDGAMPGKRVDGLTIPPIDGRSRVATSEPPRREKKRRPFVLSVSVQRPTRLLPSPAKAAPISASPTPRPRHHETT